MVGSREDLLASINLPLLLLPTRNMRTAGNLEAKKDDCGTLSEGGNISYERDIWASYAAFKKTGFPSSAALLRGTHAQVEITTMPLKVIRSGGKDCKKRPKTSWSSGGSNPGPSADDHDNRCNFKVN